MKMRLKFNQFICFLAAFAILMANQALSFAENQVAPAISTSVVEASPSAEQAATVDKSTDAAVVQASDQSTEDKQTQFLKRIKDELDLSKTDYRQVLNSISDTKKRLETVTEEKMSLQQQLGNVDDQITVATAKLFSVIGQVIEKENGIALTYNEIEAKQIELDYQKDLLKEYMSLIYQEENGLLSVGADGSVNAFKLLLTDGSVGDSLRKWKYFDMLNVAGQQMVDRLDALFQDLQKKKAGLEADKVRLEALKIELTKEKDHLELQKKSKADLLKITLGQEDVYKHLLEESVKQEEQMVADVKALSNAMDLVESKIAVEGANFDVEKYKGLLDLKTQALYDFNISSLGVAAGQFAWPVEPKSGISAYFHDPNYPGVFGVQHQAVDIPTYQGTPIRAAADGVVYTTRDNGYGYSYIILAHAGKFMTVYGHVSGILVTAGQKVAKGSVIGLSGGMPGTKGAGYMTTGPHLHFELLMSGMHVDPLNYLPLTVLDSAFADKMPEKYRKAWEEQLLEVARVKVERADK